MVTFNERDDLRERYGKPQRPAVQFTRRDDVRELMRSPMGQNYGNMMDLQSQAARQGGFDKGDPRVAELKAARRQYNRQDKYNIGNLMGYDPLEVQDMYRRNSEVLREYARPTYKQMYPVTDIARQVSGGGGLTGMLFSKILGKSKKAGKNFFDDLRTMGSNLLGGEGINGADRDVSEKELDDYAARTFGAAYPPNIHDNEFIDTENWTERENVVIPPDYPIDEGAFTSLHPFDDSRREAAIMNQYSGRRGVSTPERPNMYDVAGPWFGTAPIDDVTISDLPDEPLRVQEYDWVDDITETDTFSNLPHHSKRSMYPRDNKRVIPGYGTTYIDMEEPDIGKEEVATPAIIPFNDANREAGIAALYGQGPMWGETNRRLEGEYRDYIERTGDKLTYEEFEGAWERLHALPRGLHYQEPRAGIR